MPRWDCTGKHRGVGDADLGLKVWPNHVNMRRIMILGVQGDLVASEVFDRWHRVALQKRIYGIDCRISRKNGSACRFYKAPLGPAKISAFPPVDHRHAPVFDTSHDLLVSALARIVPSSVLSAPQAASDGLIWPRVGFASIAFPQRRLEIFFRCATSWCGARIPRETRKSPARRPSLALQPQAVRFDRSSACDRH